MFPKVSKHYITLVTCCGSLIEVIVARPCNDFDFDCRTEFRLEPTTDKAEQLTASQYILIAILILIGGLIKFACSRLYQAYTRDTEGVSNISHRNTSTGVANNAWQRSNFIAALQPEVCLQPSTPNQPENDKPPDYIPPPAYNECVSMISVDHGKY